MDWGDGELGWIDGVERLRQLEEWQKRLKKTTKWWRDEERQTQSSRKG